MDILLLFLSYNSIYEWHRYIDLILTLELGIWENDCSITQHMQLHFQGNSYQRSKSFHVDRQLASHFHFYHGIYKQLADLTWLQALQDLMKHLYNRLIV